MNDSNTYFAVLEGDALAQACSERFESYQRFVRESGLAALWERCYQRFHGMGTNGFTSHETRRKGKKGEYSAVSINHFRNLVKHYVGLAAQTRFSMDPLPRTQEWEAEMQTQRAKSVVDFYMRAHLEKTLKSAVKYAAVLGEGWEGQAWNDMLGEPVLPGVEGEDAIAADKAPIRTGDLESHPFMPGDVARDPRHPTEDVPWVITRRRVNRWRLVAQFPERREEILAVVPGLREADASMEGLYLQGHTQTGTHDSDQIYLYELWHKRVPECPDGRRALFLSESVLLFADVLAYPDVPVRRVAPDNVLGTPFGYSPSFDLLAPQEVHDMLESIAVTNARAHGVGIILAPKGSDVEPQHISKGLALVKYTPGLPKPELANFLATPAEVFNNADRFEAGMEKSIGVNGVVRGDPQASLKSGSALLYVGAQSVQFAQDFSINITAFLEEAGGDTVAIFQTFATEAIRFEVTGESGEEVQELTGDDISKVGKVKVDVGNPLAKTIAGRAQMAENLVKLGLATDAKQYMRVLETGQLEPLTAADNRQRSLVKEENERLSRARFLTGPDGALVLRPNPQTGAWEPVLDTKDMPIALATDNPLLHVPEHLAMLSSTRARNNPAFRKAVMEHVRQHHDAWWEATLKNPGMLEAVGVAPMAAALAFAQAQMAAQQPQMTQLPQGVEAAPPPGGGPPGAPASSSNVMGPMAPEEAQMPRQPSLPPVAAMATGVNPAAPGPTGGP